MSNLKDRFARVLSATTHSPVGVIPSFSPPAVLMKDLSQTMSQAALEGALAANAQQQSQLIHLAQHQHLPALPSLPSSVPKKSYFTKKNIIVLVVIAIGICVLIYFIHDRRCKQAAKKKNNKKKNTVPNDSDELDDDHEDQDPVDDDEDLDSSIPEPVSEIHSEEPDDDDEEPTPSPDANHPDPLATKTDVPVLVGVTALPPPTPHEPSTSTTSTTMSVTDTVVPHGTEPIVIPSYTPKSTTSVKTAAVVSLPPVRTVQEIRLTHDPEDPNFTRFV